MHSSASSVAQRGAAVIAEEAKKAIAARGRFLLAVSGGHTPWLMLAALAKADLPWSAIHVLQVDERVAPHGDNDRNLTHLQESLSSSQLPPEQIYAMPVESPDLQRAAAEYSFTLERLAGSPPVLDLVHLGLGPDGHTASLVPGDPVLAIKDANVAVTAPYQGRRRITLTLPIINRSRQILWVVTGSDKGQMLNRLMAGDETIPAGQVRRERSLVLADNAAAEQLSAERRKGA
ncbi:MAG TPA: 6-phosphogluconolactonase [Bryobacteraceae bacterium]|nr:6-phosphogluconolactonase [Bryobacteraceae bacterium]